MSADEIESIVQEWYATLGTPIPAYEQTYLTAYRDQEVEERKKNPLWSEPLPDSDVSIHPPPKPVYGTPEFWKDWWAKKKAKEKAAAERAAAGEVEVVVEKVKKVRISKKT